MAKPQIMRFSPGRIFILSFIMVIGIGTFLLSLPQARKVDIPLIDILFTATSATCITGLAVIPISSFTFFGKCIILILIQIGGLGLITLSIFIASLFLNLGMATRQITGEILEFERWGRLKQFLAIIIGVTFTIEAIGAILLYAQFQGIRHEHGPVFLAIFHSIAAFCSAGISLFEGGFGSINLHPFTLITISVLMVSGSIGFIVWYDFAQLGKTFIASLRGERKHFRMSLHSKIVLTATIFLIVGGGILIWLIEKNITLKGFGTLQGMIHAMFNAISARAVGFTTINLNQVSLATLFLFLILMFIGASPGSTGSGIKTSTFVVFLATVLSIMRNRESVEIAGRRIPTDQIYKIMTIVTLGTLWIFMSTFILLLLEHGFTFMQIIFEAVSAFGNCGFSTGITAKLSPLGKFTLIVTMLIGRIGSLTLVYALRKRAEKHLYQYPEERIMIG